MANGTGRWPLTGTGNAAVIGAVLAALVTIFALINGVPWERRGATAELRTEIQRELGWIRDDVREIRRMLEAR